MQVLATTLERAEFDASHFDAVLLHHVLEHVHGPTATVREVARVLRPGGLFEFVAPNMDSWAARVFGNYYHPLEAPRHLSHFVLESAERVGRLAGLRVQWIRHSPLPNDWANSLRHLVHARYGSSQTGARLARSLSFENPIWMAAFLPLGVVSATLRQSTRIWVGERKPA